MAIDYTSDLGKVRLLISDLDEPNFVYTDEQLETFLTMYVGVKRAAAAALLALAGNALLVDKVIKTQDLQTDASKVAEQMRALAKSLRDEAQQDEDDLADGTGGFSIIDFDPHAGYCGDAELAP